MKILFSVFLLLSLPIVAEEKFFDQFLALKKAGDDAALIAFFEKAAVEEAENPDYYAAAGNYWWEVANRLEISDLPAGKFTLGPDDLQLTDPETGKKVGSIGRAKERNPKLTEAALQALDQGAEKFPQRADLALGLAHVQRALGLAEESVATLSKLLATAKKDAAALRWMSNGELPGPPEQFLPEAVQEYTSALFDANTPATDALCATLLTEVMVAFPDHPYAYNLRAALADATGKPEEALKMLELAHRKAAGDSLILLNLAEAYAKAGQKEEARVSYQKLLKLEIDAETRASAEKAAAALAE